MNKIMLTFLIIILSTNAFASSANFTTVSVTKNTLKAFTKLNGNCLNYKIPTRFCIWVSPLGEVSTTPMLDHYLPDLVVVVYRNSDENPWIEAKTLLDVPANKAQAVFLPDAGSGNHGFMQGNDQAVIFKEADVIGNPALLVLPQRLTLLPSTASAMRPYFQSMLDSALWRGLMPQASVEEAASLVLGELHHVGIGLTDWGGVYPHEGTVLGNDDARASMVVAQRAADLLTNTTIFGHVRASLANTCGTHCKASPIKENSKDTLFQMISPVEEDECSVLGSDQSYQENMQNNEGAYAWIVWRHYQGCVDGEGTFIGVTP